MTTDEAVRRVLQHTSLGDDYIPVGEIISEKAIVNAIVGLLAKDFLMLVGIAFLLATPAAYFYMDNWLADFAYQIDLGPGVFLLAGLLALVMALLTVSYQAVRAALTDPVKSLRYE